MEHEKRASVELMHERYEYWENVPKPGLFIDGKPAITQIDKGMIGDYMLITVRDPLAAYGKDPAELIAERLDQPVLAVNRACSPLIPVFIKAPGYRCAAGEAVLRK